MKEEGSANTLGDGGKSEKMSKRTKIGGYIAIILLFIFVAWVNITGFSPSFDVEKVASITSWAVGANATDGFGLFKRKKYADIEVNILSAGVLDKGGVYRPNDTLTTKSIGALRIQVKNVGKIDSSTWQFRITLPTRDSYVYLSPTQNPLAKNEEKTFLFTFDSLAASSSAEIKVLAETSGEGKELENNLSTKILEIF